MPDHRKPGLLGRLRRLISGRAARAHERRELELVDEIAWLRSLLNRDEDQDYEEPDSWQAKYWQ
jgi:hypothetical protein